MKKYFAVFTVFISLFSFASQVFALETNDTLGSTFADDNSNGGMASWNDLSNLGIFLANQYATTTLTTTNTISDYMKVTGFNFSIPASSTIEGIKVRIERKKNCATCISTVTDQSVRIIKDGAIVGDEKAINTPWLTSDNARYYGTSGELDNGVSSDLWGTAWTSTDINDPDFGVAFSAQTTTDDDVLLSVDEIRVTVYYSTPSDITAPIISETTAVVTPTNDATPSYTFTTDEAGTIAYGGSCSSATTNAVLGSNTVVFNTLTEGTFSDCTITVTDGSFNASNILDVSDFIIDLTAPVITLSGSSPVDISVGDTYTDAGATASDNIDLILTINTTNPVDVNTVGNYVVSYNTSDAAGNIAVTVTRNVNVNAVAAPVPPSGGGSSGGSVPLYILVQANALNASNNTPSQATSALGEVLGAEKFIFTKFLKIGSHKRVPAKMNEIKELQMFLNKNGYGTLEVDGKFGPLTKASVVKFQLANLLVGDGSVGPLTRAILNK